MDHPVLTSDSEAALYWRLRARWLREDAAKAVSESQRQSLIDEAAKADARSRDFEESA